MCSGEIVLVGRLGRGVASQPIKIIDINKSGERILLLVGKNGSILKKECGTLGDVRRALGRIIADSDVTYTLQLANISEEYKVNMPKNINAELRHWCFF